MNVEINIILFVLCIVVPDLAVPKVREEIIPDRGVQPGPYRCPSVEEPPKFRMPDGCLSNEEPREDDPEEYFVDARLCHKPRRPYQDTMQACQHKPRQSTPPICKNFQKERNAGD